MLDNHWSHLPNAKHIDWVLASLKVHPKKWEAAWYAAYNTARTTARTTARVASYNTACNAAYDEACNAACDEARQAAFDAACTAAWNAAFDAAKDAAWNAASFSSASSSVYDAILALIAYDDCAYMIESEVGELKIIAAFGDPRAILLLPACIAFNELTKTSIAV